MRAFMMGAIVAAAMTAGAGTASAAIIDFGGLDSGAFPASYTEDGFTVTATGASVQGSGFGNPGPSVLFGPVFAPVAGSITITDGTFTFGSVDLASNNGGAAYTFSGYYLGNLILSVAGTATAGFAPTFPFYTYASGSAALLDTLVIAITPGQGATSINLDNIVVNRVAVPEPVSLSLFGLGLVGLGLSRRRKAN